MNNSKNNKQRLGKIQTKYIIVSGFEILGELYELNSRTAIQKANVLARLYGKADFSLHTETGTIHAGKVTPFKVSKSKSEQLTKLLLATT